MYGLCEEDSNELTKVSEQVRKRIVDGEIPNDLEDELVRAYREFSEKIGIENPEVAVRSSATAEDLPEASFAGQQDTYLHISGEKELVKYIRECWASLWTSRAIYYRVKQNFDHFAVSLAVVVQLMVESEKSGVIFTANPINSNTDEMMINASWGLGEAVVSGLVTPDEYVIDKKNRQVKDIYISSKNNMVIKDKSGQGTLEVKVMDQLGEEYINKECLSEEELKTLIDYSLKIEELYGSYQDIEWGFDRHTKKLYILQSRPITTIEAKKDEGKKPLVVLTKASL